MAGVFLWTACDKDDDPSDRFRYLTQTIWVADSLLVNGIDAGSPGGLLEDFRGDVDFREDRTGSFGTYEGTWMFNQNETELAITSDALTMLPMNTLNAKIDELNETSLKIFAYIPNLYDPENPLQLRLTFRPKLWRFKILTETIWISDSLLFNDADASHPGGILEGFKGESVFREDGTGKFGVYEGTWEFQQYETELLIRSDSLTIFPLNLINTKIDVIKRESLKLFASFPNPYDPTDPLRLRLTFVPK